MPLLEIYGVYAMRPTVHRADGRRRIRALIACANVREPFAIARGGARARISIRMAIGAGRAASDPTAFDGSDGVIHRPADF